MRLSRIVLVACLLPVLVACGDDDASSNVIETTTSTVPDETSTSSTGTEPTTTTTAFDGATTPTSSPSTASGVALLADVQVEPGVVTFTFRDDLPGFDVRYVDPPIRQDASGEEIAVAGRAFLSVRMEPASGVDLSGEDFEETYTGPDRIGGTGAITEVVRTGDFEANATWVVGLDAERAYRVEAVSSMLRVYFST